MFNNSTDYTQPYSDEYLYYDENEEMYILTEQTLVKRGIDLRYRLAATNSPNIENTINSFCVMISDMIYNYIYEFSTNNEYQKYIINHSLFTRNDIIKKSLITQALYVASVGNLLYSSDEKKRKFAIDEQAKKILNKTIPSVGNSIIYCGLI